jgi:hypothetical protein
MLAHDGLRSGPAELLERHVNILLLVQLPLMGVACALVFRSARLTWPEHMVLAAYTLAVRAVVLALLAALAYPAGLPAPSLGQVYAFWAAWYVYFGWAASQFYAGKRCVTWPLGALAAGLGHLAIVAVIMAASAVYDRVVAH